MKVGLFLGSFNPIHIGHLIVANLIYEKTDRSEIWFVVSPQNPFKKNKQLRPTNGLVFIDLSCSYGLTGRYLFPIY